MSDTNDAQRPGSPHVAIANAIVKLFADHTGRGATQARTVISADLVAVVLRESMTKADRALLAAGHVDIVRDVRARIQDVIRDEAIAAVETITGRRVTAMLSDHDLSSDVAVEAFVLEPERA